MIHPMLRYAVTLLWLSIIGFAAAQPKIALVRVADIHRQLDSTKEREAAIKAEREQVGKDARLRAYHAVLRELEQVSKKLKAALADTDNPDNSIREGLKRDYALKVQEAKTLHEEYKSFRSERLRQINAKMVSQMEESLAEIHRAAAEVGREKGFDWILDSSGQTNTGVPFVLYAKNPTDLTPDVLAALGQPVTNTADTSR